MYQRYRLPVYKVVFSHNVAYASSYTRNLAAKLRIIFRFANNTEQKSLQNFSSHHEGDTMPPVTA